MLGQEGEAGFGCDDCEGVGASRGNVRSRVGSGVSSTALVRHADSVPVVDDVAAGVLQSAGNCGPSDNGASWLESQAGYANGAVGIQIDD